MLLTLSLEAVPNFLPSYAQNIENILSFKRPRLWKEE